jgi:hypothetical protein
MTHSRAAFGVTPSRGRQQWPGKAGSTLAWTKKQRPSTA